MRKLVLFFLMVFLAAPAYPWTYSLDFEGGDVGIDAVPYSSGGFTGVLVNVKFDNTRAHGGSKSAKFTMGPTGCESLNDRTAFGYLDHPDIYAGGEVWTRWYQWIPTDWVWSESFNKVFRYPTVTTSDAGEGALGIGDGWGGVYYGNEPTDHRSSDFTSMTKGQWQCFEVYHKISMTAPIVRVWRDGVLVFENTTWISLRTSTNRLTQAEFYGTINCPGISVYQSMWIDDIIITNETPSGRDVQGNPMIGTGGYVPPSDTDPPQLISASIGTNGTTVALSFGEAVTGGTSGTGGFVLDTSGAAITLEYSSGSGSSTLYYTASRTVQYNETAAVITYTKPGSAFVEDLAGNDLAAISTPFAATNYSNQGIPAGDPPVMSNLLPTGAQTCSSDPQPITFSVTTDEVATCRGTLVNQDFDSMGEGANFDDTGAEATDNGDGTYTHTSIGLPGIACGNTFTLHVHCRDSEDNTTVTPGLISASVSQAAAPSTPHNFRINPGGSSTHYDPGGMGLR